MSWTVKSQTNLCVCECVCVCVVCVCVWVCVCIYLWNFKVVLNSNSTMYGTNAYNYGDLKWRMVYTNARLAYQQIATNLCLCRHDCMYIEEVSGRRYKYCKRSQMTDDRSHKFIEKPAAYLREICSKLLAKTGTIVSESAICRFLKRNNFSLLSVLPY